MRIISMFLLLCFTTLGLTTGAFAHEGGELTVPMKVADYIFSVNSLVIGSALMLATGLAYYFRKTIRNFFEKKNLVLFLSWGITIIALLGPIVFESISTWMLGIGAIMLPASLYVTAKAMKLEQNYVLRYSVMTVVYIAIALFYSSSFIGFLAIGSLIAAFGYFTEYVIEKNDDTRDSEDHVFAVLTVLTLTLIFAYSLYSMSGVQNTFSLFEPGAFWLGGIALGTALIGLSSERSNNNIFLLFNALTVSILTLGMFISSVYGLKEVTTLFFSLIIIYILMKIFDLKLKVSSKRSAQLVIAGLFSGGVYLLILSNKELAMQYLTVSL